MVVLQLINCSTKNTIDPDAIKINTGDVFIVNEGNFSVANSSLSHYDPAISQITNNLFYKVNNAPLGDVAQSITLNKNIAYIVINNSGIIYGVNLETCEFNGKINGLGSPREMIIIDDDKAYVSDLYGTKLTIVNPANYEVIDKIDIGKSSDCMVKSGKLVMVANWSAYNQTKINNTVMVIDSDTNVLIDSIVVGIEPNSMVIDKNNYLWVLCSGGYMNDEMPTLWKVNTETLESQKKFTFDNIFQNPDNLCINLTRDTLYFLNDGVYRLSVTDLELPAEAIINENGKNYYSLGVDPVRNEIYVSDALDYNQNGIVTRYNFNGTLISSFEAGIIPGDFGFNY